MQEKKTYKSKNMKPATKAYYVNKWIAFSKAFKNVSLEDWCARQNLSTGTFYGWLKDPKYNKELRVKKEITQEASEPIEKPKKTKEAVKHEEPIQLSLLDSIEPEKMEVEKKEEPMPKPELTIGEDPSADTDTDIGNITFTGPYITFTCPDYRIEISRVIPVQDVNRVLGFASAMMHRKESRKAEMQAKMRA